MHFFTPIPAAIGGPNYCVNVEGRTPTVRTGDATGNDLTGIWTLYNLAPNPNDPVANPYAESDGDWHAGSVSFGVQCGTSANIHVYGAISPYSINEQSIVITLDGVQVWEKHISDYTTDDYYVTAESVNENVVIPLTNAPCGHIIKIAATTGDKYAHNFIFWDITATITP